MTTDTIRNKPSDTDFTPGDPLRWRAVITFLTDAGTISDVQTFQEIEDLHQIIEEGPNFYAIRDIVITVNPAYLASYPGLKTTLQESARQ